MTYQLNAARAADAVTRAAVRRGVSHSGGRSGITRGFRVIFKTSRGRSRVMVHQWPGTAATASRGTPNSQELIGCDEDGNMSLWSVGDVLPMTAFDFDWSLNGDINGHYVIDWKNHAITIARVSQFHVIRRMFSPLAAGLRPMSGSYLSVPRKATATIA